MVAADGCLSDLSPQLPGHDGQRRRRYCRRDAPLGLSQEARRRGYLADAGLPVAHGRQRLRYQRLYGHRRALRHDRRYGYPHCRREKAGYPRRHGPGVQPHVGPARLVPGIEAQPHERQSGLVHLARCQRRRLGADELALHLRRPGLDVVRRTAAVLPAHLRRRTARFELGKSGRPPGPL